MNHYNALLQLFIKATGFMVSEDFKFFPLYKEAQGTPKMDSNGHIGMIYPVDQKTLLYTKYINYGPHRSDFYSFFSITSL